jgi:hypothetical protein
MGAWLGAVAGVSLGGIGVWLVSVPIGFAMGWLCGFFGLLNIHHKDTRLPMTLAFMCSLPCALIGPRYDFEPPFISLLMITAASAVIPFLLALWLEPAMAQGSGPSRSFLVSAVLPPALPGIIVLSLAFLKGRFHPIVMPCLASLSLALCALAALGARVFGAIRFRLLALFVLPPLIALAFGIAAFRLMLRVGSPVLESSLTSPDRTVRMWVADLFVKERAVSPFRRAWVRVPTARYQLVSPVVLMLPDPEAEDFLCTAAQDDVVVVYSAAIRALDFKGSPRSIPCLEAVANDPVRFVGYAELAKRAILHIRDRNARTF